MILGWPSTLPKLSLRPDPEEHSGDEQKSVESRGFQS
jgi:hypothetical protein